MYELNFFILENGETITYLTQGIIFWELNRKIYMKVSFVCLRHGWHSQLIPSFPTHHMIQKKEKEREVSTAYK